MRNNPQCPDVTIYIYMAERPPGGRGAVTHYAHRTNSYITHIAILQSHQHTLPLFYPNGGRLSAPLESAANRSSTRTAPEYAGMPLTNCHTFLFRMQSRANPTPIYICMCEESRLPRAVKRAFISIFYKEVVNPSTHSVNSSAQIGFMCVLAIIILG